MTTLSNYDLILTQEDFNKNYENSTLLSNVRYENLLWIDEVLHTRYTAIMGGKEIQILTY